MRSTFTRTNRVHRGVAYVVHTFKVVGKYLGT